MGDFSFNRHLFPEIVEGVEHVDAAGVAEVPAVLVFAEIHKDKATPGPKFAGSCQQYVLPIFHSLVSKSFEYGIGRPNHVYMMVNLTGFFRQVMHRGRREPKIERPIGEELLVKTGAAGVHENVIEFVKIGVL